VGLLETSILMALLDQERRRKRAFLGQMSATVPFDGVLGHGPSEGPAPQQSPRQRGKYGI
jgi:hypothetical protein